MTTFWDITIDNSSYILRLNDGNQIWEIWKENEKILFYDEDSKRWVGVHNGKLVRIEWPTFRDIMNRYIEIVKNGKQY
jgi:hypothetical protein